MFHILGFIVSRDSYMNRWEVIQPAKEGKLEVSYRWFRTCEDAEDWCMQTCQRVWLVDSVKILYQVSSTENGTG